MKKYSGPYSSRSDEIVLYSVANLLMDNVSLDVIMFKM